jgi:hypothetical protein
VSGNLGVVTPTGTTLVKNLQVGDQIRGIGTSKTPEWCNVLAIGSFGEGTLFGNYTKGHYILSADGNAVESHGEVGTATNETKYSMMLNCPLALDESNTAFSVADENLCGDHVTRMDWPTYLSLHKGISRVVVASGTFWFSDQAYQNLNVPNSSVITTSEGKRAARVKAGGSTEVLLPLSWGEFTPRLCSALIKCTEDRKDCQDLETAGSQFIDYYLTGDAQRRAYEAFPNMGKVGEQGSISYAVADDGGFISNTGIAAVVVAAVVVVASVVVVAIVVVKKLRARRQRNLTLWPAQ